MEENTEGTLNGMEKSPLQSKKFVAMLVSEISWKVVILAMLFWGAPAWLVAITVLVCGFLEVAYIGGQAALDRYTRLAHIAVNGLKPSNGSMARIVSRGTKGLVEVPEGTPETPEAPVTAKKLPAEPETTVE